MLKFIVLLTACVIAVSRNRFEGQVCIVTGGTSGIGEAVAIALAGEGCKVVFTGRREEKGAEVLAKIEAAGGEGLYVKADVTKEEDNKLMVDLAVKTYGRLDAAFNNAGIYQPHTKLHEIDLSTWQRVLNVNLQGVFLSMKYELKQFLAQGEGGSILNCNSIFGRTSFGFGSSPYITSKHGLTGLTKTAALEYAHDNIRVNDLNPGFTDEAGIVAEGFNAYTDVMKFFHPNGKLNSLKGVVNTALFAMSKDAIDVSGTQLEVSSGLTGGFITNTFLKQTIGPEFARITAEMQAAEAEETTLENEACDEASKGSETTEE